MTSLAKNPGTSVAPACQVPNPNGCRTVATIRKETYSIKWTLFSMVYPLATAYILALAFYQIARLIV